MRDSNIIVTISTENKKLLQDKAKQERMTLSDVTRILLQKWLENKIEIENKKF